MKLDIIDIVLGIVSTIINIISYFIVKRLTSEIKVNFKWLIRKASKEAL